jgi:hypothetical protein
VKDVPESDGDYILVSSFMTEDSFVACKRPQSRP